MKASILIVDDEKNARDGLRAALEDRYEVYVAADTRQAMNVLESEKIDLVLTDLRMAGEDGLTLIDRAQKLPSQPSCVLMTAYGSVETAVQALKRGAADYLIKPLNLDEVEHLITRLLRTRNLEQENQRLREKVEQKFGLEKIIGSSPVMNRIFDQIRQVASSQAAVLIEGESGTGKELVANAIHQLSQRRAAPMITVHCAALSPQLLESELFGHEKGSFTGATERRIGRFEAADGGSIFLDEIGEIDPSTQVKLLRVLGQRTFERVGSTKTLTVDVRIIAATNKDLTQLMEQGKFRDDLYYRLNVVTLQMPPLRERPEDIPLLLKAFLEEFNRDNNKQVERFSQPALDRLLHYRWPGNVRELRAAVEHAVVFAPSTTADLEHLPLRIRQEPPAPSPGSPGSPLLTPSSTASPSPLFSAQPTPAPLDWHQNEKRLIEQALLQTDGNRTDAAKLLGMSRRTLHRKLVRYELQDFHPDT